tara:strand:+ start:553 stop:888 length:336 start_codon:yes stop_codon:yes gene_type:complete
MDVKGGKYYEANNENYQKKPKGGKYYKTEYRGKMKKQTEWVERCDLIKDCPICLGKNTLRVQIVPYDISILSRNLEGKWEKGKCISCGAFHLEENKETKKKVSRDNNQFCL